MATLGDIQALGYVCGIAQGSVAVEEDALAQARADADPTSVAEQANVVTSETVQTLDKLGRLPETPEERLDLASKIAASALDMLTTAATERIAFHERAVALAQDMPDVWRIEQRIGAVPADGAPDGRTVVVSLLVACKSDGTGWDADAQAMIDSLADQDAFAERAWQIDNADALTAAARLAADGQDVKRDPGDTSFTVAGKAMSADQILVAADKL